MGQRSKLKKLRRQLTGFVQAEQTPAGKASVLTELVGYGLFTKKKAREVLDLLTRPRPGEGNGAT